MGRWGPEAQRSGLLKSCAREGTCTHRNEHELVPRGYSEDIQLTSPTWVPLRTVA